MELPTQRSLDLCEPVLLEELQFAFYNEEKNFHLIQQIKQAIYDFKYKIYNSEAYYTNVVDSEF